MIRDFNVDEYIDEYYQYLQTKYKTQKESDEYIEHLLELQDLEYENRMEEF